MIAVDARYRQQHLQLRGIDIDLNSFPIDVKKSLDPGVDTDLRLLAFLLGVQDTAAENGGALSDTPDHLQFADRGDRTVPRLVRLVEIVVILILGTAPPGDGAVGVQPVIPTVDHLLLILHRHSDGVQDILPDPVGDIPFNQQIDRPLVGVGRGDLNRHHAVFGLVRLNGVCPYLGGAMLQVKLGLQPLVIRFLTRSRLLRRHGRGRRTGGGSRGRRGGGRRILIGQQQHLGD